MQALWEALHAGKVTACSQISAIAMNTTKLSKAAAITPPTSNSPKRSS